MSETKRAITRFVTGSRSVHGDRNRPNLDPTTFDDLRDKTVIFGVVNMGERQTVAVRIRPRSRICRPSG